jgi:hypothetical protein
MRFSLSLPPFLSPFDIFDATTLSFDTFLSFHFRQLFFRCPPGCRHDDISLLDTPDISPCRFHASLCRHAAAAAARLPMPPLMPPARHAAFHAMPLLLMPLFSLSYAIIFADIFAFAIAIICRHYAIAIIDADIIIFSPSSFTLSPPPPPPLTPRRHAADALPFRFAAR